MTDDRLVRVAAERLAGWVERFADRHGPLVTAAGPDKVILSAPDGAVAVVTVPFPPLTGSLVEHVGRDRRVGALLVRRGGYAVGVFAGANLGASKVGRRYVQGRTKAGGWSQQRFARRRSNQADQAYADAAEAAYAVLGPRSGDLEALVGGGDRSGVEAVLADSRLAGLRGRWDGRVLPTADPRLDVLRQFGDQLRAVEIRLNPLA